MITLSDCWYEYAPNVDEETGQEAKAQPAVRGVSFSIQQGEFVCIIGHNGSGKSTVAKMMNALYLPTRGDVTVCGMNTKDEMMTLDIRRTVGLVQQNPDNQIVTTIVEEDVAFGLENLGFPPGEIRTRVDETLEAVGLTKFAQYAPHTLSGGQKQRVAIAGILAMQPQAMVMDEPTAMLDPEGRREVIATMERLRKEKGLTLVLITHFMDEAIRADRVIVMEDGAITMDGAPRDVLCNEKELERAGLETPRSMALADRLRARGLPLAQGIMTRNELVEGLCALKRTN